MSVPPGERVIRFGKFEVDLHARELRKLGLRIKLADQPFQILAVLLERPGHVVTREELQAKLWPAETFVDFDRGLNKAMNRLRDALGDAAEAPRFIETLPKRGYRFIGELDAAVPSVGSACEEDPIGSKGNDRTQLEAPPPKRVATWKKPVWKMIIGLGLVVLLVAVAVRYPRNPRPAGNLVRASLLPPPGSSFVPYNFALSPDGTRLAFAAETASAKRSMWIRSLSAGRIAGERYLRRGLPVLVAG
jgi:DNA-binding winged helix-turn-helix (wHTH) protein